MSSKEPSLHFKKAGIHATDVMAFPGFCNACDTRLFLPIESKSLDFTNKTHLLLYSYRAVVCELHKVDSWLMCFEEMKDDTWYDETLRNIFNDMLLVNKLRRNGFINQQFLLYNNLFNNVLDSAPNFAVYKVAKQGVACSATYFPLICLDEEMVYNALNINPMSYDFPFSHTAVYVHAVPTDGELFVVIGCHKNVTHVETIPIKDLKILDERAILVLLSTLFIKRIETWSISETLYSVWSRGSFDKAILNIKTHYLDERITDQYMYNLFHSTSMPVGVYLWEGANKFSVSV